MAANPEDYGIPKVLVIRVDGGQKVFRWEIRVVGRGLPLMASDGIFASEAEARQAGERALETLPGPYVRQARKVSTD